MGYVVHSTYTTGTLALPDIYAQARGRVRIYQAKHSSLWYKYNILGIAMYSDMHKATCELQN